MESIHLSTPLSGAPVPRRKTGRNGDAAFPHTAKKQHNRFSPRTVRAENRYCQNLQPLKGAYVSGFRTFTPLPDFVFNTLIIMEGLIGSLNIRAVHKYI
jgi:hypothetical protein